MLRSFFKQVFICSGAMPRIEIITIFLMNSEEIQAKSQCAVNSYSRTNERNKQNKSGVSLKTPGSGLILVHSLQQNPDSISNAISSGGGTLQILLTRPGRMGVHFLSRAPGSLRSAKGSLGIKSLPFKPCRLGPKGSQRHHLPSCPSRGLLKSQCPAPPLLKWKEYWIWNKKICVQIRIRQ